MPMTLKSAEIICQTVERRLFKSRVRKKTMRDAEIILSAIDLDLASSNEQLGPSIE